MSEYSESFHLRADNQMAGVDLLKWAGTTGAVFAPVRGWVTVIPDMLGPDIRIVNKGILFYYNFAEDHSWNFELFDGPTKISEFVCVWDGPEAVVECDEGFRLDHGLAINDDNLNIDKLVKHLLNGTNEQELRRILDAGQSWTDPPAYQFARLIGLEHYKWLAHSYLDDARKRDQNVIILG